MSAPYNRSGWKGPLETSWSNSLVTAEPTSTFSPAPKLDQMAQDLVCSSNDYLQGGGSLSRHLMQSLSTLIPKSFSLLSDNRCQLKKSNLLYFCWIGKTDWLMLHYNNAKSTARGVSGPHSKKQRTGNYELEHHLIDGLSQGTCLHLPKLCTPLPLTLVVHSFPTTCWAALFLFCHLLSHSWSLCSHAVNQRETMLFFQLSALLQLQPAVPLALDGKKVFYMNHEL